MNTSVFTFLIILLILNGLFFLYLKKMGAKIDQNIALKLLMQTVMLILGFASIISICYYSLFPHKLTEEYQIMFPIFAIIGALILFYVIVYQFYEFIKQLLNNKK